MEDRHFGSGAASEKRVLVVIPCLNEAAHIATVIRTVLADTEDLNLKLVVADGGSTDGTQQIVVGLGSADHRIFLLDNPRRIQSAAVNLVVREFGADFDLLVRIDAHADYPRYYVRGLVDAQLATGASSVVVPMLTVGKRCFQKGVAAAQNSRLGNGGSAHRSQGVSHFVDHGHHALMDIGAFTSVGGYDESFSHNEDAELDHRLRQAGYTIWLEVSLQITYYPRESAWPLLKQYYKYGQGRARNLRKHNGKMKARQALPLLVAPAVVIAIGGMIYPILLFPFFVWATACIIGGVLLAFRSRSVCEAFAGPAAMIMHFGWSAGFIYQWALDRIGKI